MKKALGADLVIPALALGFATYFFVSIADLAWEAKANGVVIGGILVALIVLQVLRIGIRVAVEKPWRYWVEGHVAVSGPRSSKRRRAG